MKTINRFSANVIEEASRLLSSCDYVGVTDVGGDVEVDGVGLTKCWDEVCFSTVIAKKGFAAGLSFSTPRNEVEVQYVA